MTSKKYSTYAANECVKITIDQLLKEAGMELSLKGELEKMKKEKEFD